jgi:hypothetical protein
MSEYLAAENFASASRNEEQQLARDLETIKTNDLKNDVFAMLGDFGRILADNSKKDQWDGIFAKLMTLFKCGKSVPLDGPMIGVTLAIRDNDYFRETARLFGSNRSVIADIEWMATCWNATFAPTGLWMGEDLRIGYRGELLRGVRRRPATDEALQSRCQQDRTEFFPRTGESGLYPGARSPRAY